MKINLIAGVTPCPYAYYYDGSLGDDLEVSVRIKESDGSYTDDYGLSVNQSADGSIITFQAQPGDDGNFQDDYKIVLSASNSLTPASSGFTFPLYLPYTLQY